MTHSTRPGKIRAMLVPAIAGLVLAGGLALMSASPATATPTTTTEPSVTSENFDTSEFVQTPPDARKRGGGDCDGKPCTPITWCEDKPGGDHSKDVTSSAQTGDVKTTTPDCVKKPTGHVDDKDCCKSPSGGTIYVKMYNSNDFDTPVQITVTVGDKSYTKNGWIKPGKTVVKLKNLPNGKYKVKVHFYDCVFFEKRVKVDCDKASPSPSVTVSPSASVSATPSNSASATPSQSTSSAPAGGTGGGDNELPKTGVNMVAMGARGGVLLALGGLMFLFGRRSDTAPTFVAE